MKIAIDLTSLSYHMSGIERYASCITEEMLKIDKKNEYILVFRESIYVNFQKYIDNKRVTALILRGDKKVIFLQFILPCALYKIKADKYLFFAFTSPILFRKKGIINTIHDMGAWDFSDSMSILQKLYWKCTYRVAARTSEKIITVSNFSKNRINALLRYPMDHIYVAYSAVYDGIKQISDNSFANVQKKYKLPKKYIMTLSTLEPRKNLELLLKAFTNIQDSVDYDLVLVGRKGWKMDDVLDKFKIKKRIHITGFVDDEDVSLIYKNALCFVFPSLYEGFGLPPVEALALGTPVISSDAASLPEILMNQVVYFKSNSEPELELILNKIECNLSSMPNCLNEFQLMNYNFNNSARKILKLIGG